MSRQAVAQHNQQSKPGLIPANRGILQRKLTIGASHDPLEHEADRVADQVMAASTHSPVNNVPLRIQRFSGQADGQMEVPDSVGRVLAGSGRPLEPTLKQDMEQRFGQDFSQVRVHSGGAAEQSALDVNANAYTVGHNIVFGAGQFTPGTFGGQRLLAHELTHTLQQTRGGRDYLIQREQKESQNNVSSNPCTSNNLGHPSDEFECYYNRVFTSYESIFNKQKGALDLLKDTAGEDDDSSLLQDLVVTALCVALAAATGGIGSAIALGVTRKLATMAIGSAVIKIAADMAKDGATAAIEEVKNIGGKKVKSAISIYPVDSGNSDKDKERVAKIFFGSQVDTLIDALKATKDNLGNKKGLLRRDVSSGIKVVKALAEEVENQCYNAGDRQRFESISQWVVYQAKCSRGKTAKKGVDLKENKNGLFSSDPGVLLLEGHWYSGEQLLLESASLDGVNSALKPDIAKTPIGKLKIPVKVRLEVGKEYGLLESMDGKDQPYFYCWRNELGEMGVDLRFKYSFILLADELGIGQLNFDASGRIYRSLNDTDVFNIVSLIFKKMQYRRPPLK